MKKMHLIYAHKTKTCQYTVPLHTHSYYELVYYRYGSGSVYYDGQSHDFSFDSFVLLPPLTEHSDILYTECEYYCICFETKEFLPTGFFADEEKNILKIIKAILSETHDQPFCYDDMIDALLAELAIVLNRLNHGNPRQNRHKSFEYIANYIAENYHEKIVMQDLAEQMNFSYDYFQHRFKELFGLSPQQLLIRKRIEAAEALLKNSTLSCTQIAYRCGFSNSAQFSTIFRREYAASPLQYRQRCQNRT